MELDGRLTEDDLYRLREVGTEVSFDAGHVLIESRQAALGLFLILEGDVVVEAPEGTRELGAGALVGERAMFSVDGTRTARVRAASDLRVLAVDRSGFEQLCADEPDLARRLDSAAGADPA
jgi:CRP-like cAMP-binding protein